MGSEKSKPSAGQVGFSGRETHLLWPVLLIPACKAEGVAGLRSGHAGRAGNASESGNPAVRKAGRPTRTGWYDAVIRLQFEP